MVEWLGLNSKNVSNGWKGRNRMQKELTLVELKKNKAVTTSLMIANKFGKQHKNILSIIESKKYLFNELNFKPDKYVDNKGEERPMYYLDRDFATFIIMGFTGEKADAWKLKYIQAFNQMEKIIMEKNTSVWLEQRTQGKLTRKAETDTIKSLIDYAKMQGSEHSNMLYVTYSKLANKMADIESRDNATLQQLNELSFIENIILNQIIVGMESNQHYKEIYQDCKKQIELFKVIAYLEKK